MKDTIVFLVFLSIATSFFIINRTENKQSYEQPRVVRVIPQADGSAIITDSLEFSGEVE